jgi:cysteine desulfurase
MRPEAAAALAEAGAFGGNPSSIHAAGRAARARLEAARETLAAAVGAAVSGVVFTSGATEALHLALHGARAAGMTGLVLSGLEHDALAEEAARAWPGAITVPARPDGLIDLEAFAAALAAADKPALAAVMLANNETGAIQPVAQAARLARQAGAVLLVDAAQALGRIPIDMQAMDAAFLVVSSHKAGGPAGAGLLALAPGAPFAGPRAGGGQERGRRPGTENMPAACGFAAAAAAGLASMAGEQARLGAIRDAFEETLLADAPDAEIFARAAPRLAQTSLVAVPGLAAETALMGLDLEGFAASSGAACSSGKVRASRVLAAMGAAPNLAGSAIRASFGWASAPEDGVELARALLKVRGRARDAMKGAA